jgi:hypothetical protein
MIPQEVIDFTGGKYFGYVGSRDENMVPMVRRCWGVKFSSTHDVMIIYVVKAQYDQMLRNFQHNGRITVSLADVPDFRAYQLKGQFIKARNMTADEVIFKRQYRERPKAVMKEYFGISEVLSERYVCYTDLAIEFKVEKIFNQTPGPGAGKKVEFTQ